MRQKYLTNSNKELLINLIIYFKRVDNFSRFDPFSFTMLVLLNFDSNYTFKYSYANFMPTKNKMSGCG